MTKKLKILKRLVPVVTMVCICFCTLAFIGAWAIPEGKDIFMSFLIGVIVSYLLFLLSVIMP